MTSLTSTRATQPSSRQLLARVLDDRGLVASIRQLEPRALGRLISHVGLEDAGELIALATTAQLARVFDDDLWRSPRAGDDETFDAARFTTWLEIMLEAGAAFAAQRLVELPEDLVTHALHQLVLVLDLDEVALEVAALAEDEGDRLEKALERGAALELDQYRVIGRDADGWDALCAVLVALDQDHHDALARVLARCCALSTRDLDDDGGLYRVMTEADSLAADVGADRADRRAAAGYVAPSDARAFLRLATTTPLATARTETRDPVTRAYFRELAPPAPPARADHHADSSDTAAAPDRLTDLLRASGVLDDGLATQRALPATTDAADGPSEVALTDALATLRDNDPARHGQRLAELAYLANVLVAGAEVDGRRFRPAEATTAVLTTCGLGLAYLVDATRDPATTVVAANGADRLFRLGWRLLHERTGDPARALLPTTA
ncbi:MAG: hypothetical protein IPL61_26715 [Myxococcales bacterium]|nr:hypothetical protein [Myxococcales bacterium]